MAKSTQTRRAPQQANPSKWWEQAVEVPRAGLPDATKLAKKAKRLRRFVWAAVILFSITLLTLFISLGTHGSGGSATPADPYSATKAAAILDVDQWLEQSPQPLPGGTLLGWDYATSTTSRASASNPNGGYAIEVHHLTVADSADNLYDATVDLAVSDGIGTVVVGKPSLVPEAPSATAFDGSEWPGLQSTSVTAAVGTAVSSWATAFSSGNPATLGQAIGDTTDSFTPLTGATLGSCQTGDAAVYPDSKHSPDSIVVRVTCQIQWEGEAAPTSDSGNTWPTVSYDLLVAHASNGPQVVAWGGPGDGPSLSPYSNEIVGRTVSGTAPTPSSNPSPTVPHSTAPAAPKSTHAAKTPPKKTSKKAAKK